MVIERNACSQRSGWSLSCDGNSHEGHSCPSAATARKTVGLGEGDLAGDGRHRTVDLAKRSQRHTVLPILTAILGSSRTTSRKRTSLTSCLVSRYGRDPV